MFSKIKPLTIVLFAVIALLIYSNWRTAKQIERGSIEIPLCSGARILASPDMINAPRKWGNGVEMDLRGEAQIVHCDRLKMASPTFDVPMQPKQAPRKIVPEFSRRNPIEPTEDKLITIPELPDAEHQGHWIHLPDKQFQEDCFFVTKNACFMTD